jgi:hypothetical protein
MLAIALMTSVYLLLITGIGLLFPWSLFRSSPVFKHLIGAFWVGFALAITFLEIWQVFWPVGKLSFLILAIAGFCGWLFSWKRVREWLWHQNLAFALLLAAGAACIILFLSNLVIFSGLSTDFGLYYLQTVKWFTTYRLPPGLGDLHYRLAFNQAGFLLAAQIENGIFPGMAYYIVSPLVFSAVLLQTADGLINILRKPLEIHNTQLASAFLFFVTIKYVGESQLAGYPPDRMIYVIQIALALAVMDLFEKPYPEEAPFASRVVNAMLLIGLGLVLKTSFTAFGLVSVLAILWASFLRQGRPGSIFRPVIRGAVLAGALVIPWMVRGAIMSGYPLFPSNIISLPVSWRLPGADAASMVSVVTDWARTCSATMPLQSGTLWLLTWKNCMPPEFWQILDISLLALVATALLVILGKPMKARMSENTNALVLLGISLAALLFWLWVLPDYRFAGAAFWLLLIACILLLLKQISTFFKQSTNLKILVALSMVFLTWLSPDLQGFDVQKSTFFYPPPAIEVAKSQYPQGGIISHPMPGGWIVYSPSDAGFACWDAPLPCTQYNDIRPDLMMFDIGQLQSGFYVAPGHPSQ